VATGNAEDKVKRLKIYGQSAAKILYSYIFGKGEIYMKQILINDELTTYFITDNGRLFNQKTNNWLKGSISGGYLKYSLRHKNKRYEFLAHRLVAEYFISNPKKLPIVNHKDGNKLNNNIDNLEWVTVSENNYHAYNIGLKERSNGVNARVKYTGDLEGEIWLPYKDTVYMISNKGRAKSNKTNNLLKGKITKDGYVEWCFSIEGKKISRLAHRIVYSLFNGVLEEDLVINHKDGNKTNN
jgi:hypothetical protein